MAIFLSHGGTSVFDSKGLSDEVLVGTVAGIFRIRRNGSNRWSVSERHLEGLHIHTLVLEPSSGLLFAGAHKGSLHVSSDGGRLWQHRDNGLTKKDIYCSSFTNRQGGVKLYVGTDPAHLFESDDLGESWTEIPSLRDVPSVDKWFFPAPPKFGHVKNVAINSRDPNVVYACIEQGGLLKTTDGGQSWRELHGFDDDVHRILISPSNNDRLFLSTRMGILQSDDAGETWDPLPMASTNIGYPDALLVHPKRENVMFTAGAASRPPFWLQTHAADARIARSTDGGKNWEVMQNGLPEKIHGNVEAMAMEVYNGSFALYAGTTDGDVFFSDNEGNNWSKIVEGLPPISKAHHYLIIR